MPIPRHIHTFWSGPRNPIVDACLLRMHRANPSWTVSIHTDFAEADEVEGFERLQLQAKTDWLRTCLIAKYGGVWLDASVVCVDSVEAWVDVHDSCVVGFECPIGKHVLENWAFAAVPSHPLILAWKEEFARAIAMGFDAYKMYHASQVPKHAIHAHMPYLTMHAAYVLVHDPTLVHMRSVCDPQEGPFAYLCPYWTPNNPFRFYATLRLMLFHPRLPALLKMTGAERNIATKALYVVPVLPGSFFHRSMGVSPSTALMLTYAVIVCAMLRRFAVTKRLR